MKPIIGIIGNLMLSSQEDFFAGDLNSYVNNDYIQMVQKCGGIPFIIPVQSQDEDIIHLLKMTDKVILTGGYDIDPLLYNEQPIHELGLTMRNVDEFYFKVIKYSDELKKPVLGICKGIQALNVAYGGTLYQDLRTQKKDSLKHVQNTFKDAGTHYVNIEKNNLLYDCFKDRVLVNSFHHQAVKDIAHHFSQIAVSDDGVIEGIEKKDGTYMLGIQWHPEMMIAGNDENMTGFIKKFINM